MSSVVKIYADGYCKGSIDVYNSDGDLLLEGTSPINLYVPSGSSGANSVDSDQIDHFEIGKQGGVSYENSAASQSKRDDR